MLAILTLKPEVKPRPAAGAPWMTARPLSAGVPRVDMPPLPWPPCGAILARDMRERGRKPFGDRTRRPAWRGVR